MSTIPTSQRLPTPASLAYPGDGALPVALVTGASTGLGAAVALRLASAGRWQLVLTGADGDRLADDASAVCGIPLCGDLTTPDGCRAVARRAEELAGRVDLLVAGAGIGWADPCAGMRPEALDRLVAVNLSATEHLVRTVLPGMMRRGTGHIVLVASLARSLGPGERAAHSAIQAGLRTLAAGVRHQAHGRGVFVSVVLPGTAGAPLFDRRGTPCRLRRSRAVSPLRIADAVHRAVVRRRREVFVPAWLWIPARLHADAPEYCRRLASWLSRPRRAGVTHTETDR